MTNKRISNYRSNSKNRDWEKAIHFSDSHYSRVLLFNNPRFSIFLLCWKKGQSTPKHEHGATCLSWTKVLKGQLKTTSFDKQRREKVTLLTEKDPISFSIGEELGLHKTENSSEQEDCISLHIYTPAYINCNCSNSHKAIPIVFNLLAPPDELSEIKKSHLVQNNQHQVYTSLNALADILRIELANEGSADRPQSTIDRVGKLLESMRFNPKEINQYMHWDEAHYTRNLVAYDEKFTLLLLCWNKSQYSAIHNHAGSSCWMKMVRGSLQEVRYDDSAIKNTTTTATTTVNTNNASAAGKQSTGLKVIRDMLLPTNGVVYIDGMYKKTKKS